MINKKANRLYTIQAWLHVIQIILVRYIPSFNLANTFMLLFRFIICHWFPYFCGTPIMNCLQPYPDLETSLQLFLFLSNICRNLLSHANQIMQMATFISTRKKNTFISLFHKKIEAKFHLALQSFAFNCISWQRVSLDRIAISVSCKSNCITFNFVKIHHSIYPIIYR